MAGLQAPEKYKVYFKKEGLCLWAPELLLEQQGHIYSVQFLLEIPSQSEGIGSRIEALFEKHCQGDKKDECFVVVFKTDEFLM